MRTPEALANDVLTRVRGALALGGPPTQGDLVAMVGSAAAEAGRLLGTDDVLAVTARVRAELWGLGPLQELAERPGVTDLLVNGPQEVWLDEGSGLTRVDCDLGGEREIRALAVRLAAGAGRRLDEASPWVDARLSGGIRLHAVIPPVSPAGTLVSLRMLRREPLSLDDLVTGRSLPSAWRPVLAALVRRRAAFLVSGGTGAGKTTLLATLLSEADPEERLVLVEDVGELWPRHPHVVRLEARHANVEGRGSVSLEDLVRQALRMRPDRLVVGECRGAEVRDLLAALNTGHAGGCGTVHANATGDVPARLEALGALAGLSPRAVAAQTVAALDAVVHVERSAERRRVVEIAAVQRAPDGELSLAPALTADPDDPRKPGVRGPGWPVLRRRLGLAPLPGWDEPVAGADGGRARNQVGDQVVGQVVDQERQSAGDELTGAVGGQGWNWAGGQDPSPAGAELAAGVVRDRGWNRSGDRNPLPAGDDSAAGAVGGRGRNRVDGHDRPPPAGVVW